MPVDDADPLPALARAWAMLGQDPAAVAGAASPAALLEAALAAFDPARIPRGPDPLPAALHNTHGAIAARTVAGAARAAGTTDAGDKDMTSRVALVTGGTGGIGTAICRKLADQGHRVATNYRNEEKARAWEAQMKSEGYEFTLVKGDVT